jgi:polysaccharide biosynthesis transport protein
MELMNFLKRLKRYYAVLIFVPLITAIIAFLISLNLPDKYISHARISSATADKSQQLIGDQQQQEESKINLEFDNLLQTMTLNKVIDRVSYKLMLHDLDEANAFRKPSKLVKELSADDRSKAIKAFTALYDERRSLNPANSNEKELYKLLKSMKYDDASLKKNLTASRMENSQYINLEYASENPQLSAFMLNTLSHEFINYYTSVSNSNRSRSVQFLDSLLKEKQNALTEQTEALKQFKINNGILNLDDQAKNIYGEIADIETKKGTAQKDVVAYNMALQNIDSRFSPENKKYLESSVSGINSEIANIKDQVKLANDAYVQSGFNEKYKAKIDSLQSKLTHAIYAQTDNYASNPLVAKDNLVAQKLTMEVSRDLAKNSVQTLDNELARLNSGLQKLVPNLATIQALQSKIEVANKEYLDVLQKYNQASLEANYSSPLKIVEDAVAGDPVPNKKIVLVALSAISSFILCVLVLFVIFYFDNSVYSADQLEYAVDINVLGTLNNINGGFSNLQDLWSQKEIDTSSQLFKNSLRSIRYEIENHINDDNKVLAITSLNEGEGKTFFTESLAYAFSKMKKKVLIIDGNFMHPDISTTFDVPNFIEKFLLGDGQAKMVDNDLITIIGNKGGDGSLLELNNSKNIEDFFLILKSIYDVIIVETSAMNSMNKANAKEWISFADRVVVVFEAGRKLDETAAKHVQYLKQLNGKLTGMIMNKVITEPAPMNFNLLLDKPKNEQPAFG